MHLPPANIKLKPTLSQLVQQTICFSRSREGNVRADPKTRGSDEPVSLT